MLKTISSFINRPVVSLQTGHQVATTIDVIIDPNKLRVAGFILQSPNDTGTVLLYEDIREVGPSGILVDHYDKLAHPDELVRLKPIIDLHYELINKLVVSQSRKKFGRVSDYIVDDQTFYISRLYTKQSILTNFSGTGIVVDRSQIVEVNDKQVIIREPQATVKTSIAPAISG